MEDEKKIIEKRSSFRGWKERNKGKSNQKMYIIGILIIAVIFFTLITYAYINKKDNISMPNVNATSSNSSDNPSTNIVNTPEITEVATPKITPKIIENIVGKMNIPLLIDGFEINVTSVSSSTLYTQVWIIVRNKDKIEKSFKLGPSTVVLDNIGQQYENVHVERSAEIIQTNLAPEAMIEGAIFFEPLKEGRNAKKLILDLKVQKAEVMLEK